MNKDWFAVCCCQLLLIPLALGVYSNRWKPLQASLLKMSSFSGNVTVCVVRVCVVCVCVRVCVCACVCVGCVSVSVCVCVCVCGSHQWEPVGTKYNPSSSFN
jgi:hypothetical protein